MSTPKRPYRQRVRAEAAAETRRAIIDAVRAQLVAGPLRSVGLPEVASDAGVARSTIYATFGSRAGLMEAVAEDVLQRAGFDRVGAAFRHPDAVVAVETSLREAAQVYAAEHAVGRAIFRLAAIDGDAARGAARLERGRAAGMAALAARLEAQGALRDGISAAEAADLLWVITSFDTFDQLYVGRGLAPELVGERLVALARRGVLR